MCKFFIRFMITIVFSINFGCQTTLVEEYANRRHEISKFCNLVKEDLPKNRETPSSKTICLVQGYGLQKQVEYINAQRMSFWMTMITATILLVTQSLRI